MRTAPLTSWRANNLNFFLPASSSRSLMLTVATPSSCEPSWSLYTLARIWWNTVSPSSPAPGAANGLPPGVWFDVDPAAAAESSAVEVFSLAESTGAAAAEVDGEVALPNENVAGDDDVGVGAVDPNENPVESVAGGAAAADEDDDPAVELANENPELGFASPSELGFNEDCPNENPLDVVAGEDEAIVLPKPNPVVVALFVVLAAAPGPNKLFLSLSFP